MFMRNDAFFFVNNPINPMAAIMESQEYSSRGLAAFIFTAVTLSDILILPAPKNSPVP